MKYYLSFFFSLFSIIYLHSQESYIHVIGRVTDNNNEALPGVTIQIKKTKYGTVTDLDGYYHLRGKCENGGVLVYSFIGKKNIEIKYVGQKQQDVVMTEDAALLKEVVITPKQNINEIDIRSKTGVVQEVDMKRLIDKPMLDMSLALQGSVPGLIVTNTGDLGSKPEIRIRGNSSLRKGDAANEPLYIMDGQVISSDAFMTLNPMDIKEIKVLKDAVACALYGIKAANGVLEITSRRGVPDGQMQVRYDFNMGITTRGRRGIELMKTNDKLELERRIGNKETPGYRYSEDYYRTYYASDPRLDEMIAYGKNMLDSLRTIDTDWFDELFRLNLYQRHNLSLRGGTDATSYYASVNYAKQGGRIPGNDIQRVGANLRLDQKLGNWGYFSLSTVGGYSKTNTPNGSDYSPTDLVYYLNPYETKQSKELISYLGRGYKDLINQYSSQSTDKRGGVTGSLNIEPLRGLKIDGVIGFDFVLNESLNFTPSTAFKESTSGIALSERGILMKNKNTVTNISSNLRLTYNTVFNEKHDLTVGFNVDFNRDDRNNISIIGYGVGTHPIAAAINQSITGHRKPKIGSLVEKTAQKGFGTVLGYSYNSTYDLLGTYKIDASSVLPKDKRWNAAWAIGLGWNINQYPFLKNNSVIDYLNLKGSYGKIANLAGVSASSTIGTFSYSEDYYEDSRLLRLLSLYNRDLKAEQTTSVDLGLSIGLFKKINLGVNLYKRKIDDALLDIPIPSSNGFGMIKRNIGVLSNEGVELSASVNVLNTKDWRLSVRGSLAYNRNKVLDLYYSDKIYSGDSFFPEYEKGKPYDVLYGFESLGVNPQTGYPVLRGDDGSEKDPFDQTITRDDVVVLGKTRPPYNGSINLSLSYKNFDLDLDFYYVFGGMKSYNSLNYVRYEDNIRYNAISNQLQGMWFQKGDEGKIYPSPRLTSSSSNILGQNNSKSVGKNDYIKLSMLSLRYRVPQEFLKKNCGFIKYSNLSFQASNLFIITSYKEADPESGSLAGVQQPVFTLNLSVTF